MNQQEQHYLVNNTRLNIRLIEENATELIPLIGKYPELFQAVCRIMDANRAPKIIVRTMPNPISFETAGPVTADQTMNQQPMQAQTQQAEPAPTKFASFNERKEFLGFYDGESTPLGHQLGIYLTPAQMKKSEKPGASARLFNKPGYGGWQITMSAPKKATSPAPVETPAPAPAVAYFAAHTENETTRSQVGTYGSHSAAMQAAKEAVKADKKRMPREHFTPLVIELAADSPAVRCAYGLTDGVQRWYKHYTSHFDMDSSYIKHLLKGAEIEEDSMWTVGQKEALTQLIQEIKAGAQVFATAPSVVEQPHQIGQPVTHAPTIAALAELVTLATAQMKQEAPASPVAGPTIDEMESALTTSGFFVGGLTDSVIEHYYTKLIVPSLTLEADTPAPVLTPPEPIRKRKFPFTSLRLAGHAVRILHQVGKCAVARVFPCEGRAPYYAARFRQHTVQFGHLHEAEQALLTLRRLDNAEIRRDNEVFTVTDALDQLDLRPPCLDRFCALHGLDVERSYTRRELRRAITDKREPKMPVYLSLLNRLTVTNPA